PFKNLIGMRNWPKKITALFNSYECVDYAGNSAIKVAFAETKDIDKQDLDIGRDEEVLFKKYRDPIDINVNDLVLKHVKLFVTPQNIPSSTTSSSISEVNLEVD